MIRFVNHFFDIRKNNFGIFAFAFAKKYIQKFTFAFAFAKKYSNIRFRIRIR